MSIRIEASSFFDNKERVFIPYKGWNIKDSDGEIKADEFTKTNDGPLKMIPDPLGHGNRHTLLNLINNEGDKVLQRGVRSIKYYSEGYYIAENNNEDELIYRNGGYLTTADYIKLKNIISKEGKLLSDIWFDDVCPMINGHFLVSHNGKSNLMSVNGQMLLNNYERNLQNVIEGVAFSFHDGVLYSNTNNQQQIFRELEQIEANCKYKVPFHHESLYGSEIIKNLPKFKERTDTIIIRRERDEKINLMDTEGYVLFEKWFNEIRHTTIKGLFIVKDSNNTYFMDIGGRILRHIDFEPITEFKNNLLLVMNGDSYGIMDTQCKLILEGFTSAMWADRGIWGINIENKGKRYHGSHGEGNALTSYAQQLLTSNWGDFLLEKDDVWYLVSPFGELRPYIKASPTDVTKNLKKIG